MYNIREIKKLNRLVFSSALTQCTSGKIILQDDECVAELNGSFKSMFIRFNGTISIRNNLPDGYSISFIRNMIYIRNILGRNIKNNNILFRIESDIEILAANIYNWNGKLISLDVDDKNKLDKIKDSNTNFEDSTLILGQKEISLIPRIKVKRNTIDDTSIKGLYARKPLPNGYTGYYHYYPDKKIYMTGKRPSNTSVPILISKSNSKKIKDTKRIVNKIKLDIKKLGLDKADMDKSSNIKPVKSKEKELQEITKYEQVLPQKGKQEKIIKTPSSVKKGKY